MSIEKIKGDNFEVIGMVAYYLNNHSDFINSQMVNELAYLAKISKEEAFFILFCEAVGLDIVNNKEDMYLAMTYLKRGIKKLNKNVYENNLYYKNIKTIEDKIGNWEFRYLKYKPYEAFIYDDLIVEGDIEIPQIGYFDEEFKYLSVLENGQEWMLITPNEINTMQPVIDSVSGNVVTFGLGLGYFAYMASEKENVDSVTIVERDKNVIELFTSYILPQFKHRDKIKIVNEDAFDFASTMEGYDYAFVDLWHDVGDGTNLYIRMKQLEKKETKYYYWIEKSILSRLKWTS